MSRCNWAAAGFPPSILSACRTKRWPRAKSGFVQPFPPLASGCRLSVSLSISRLLICPKKAPTSIYPSRWVFSWPWAWCPLMSCQALPPSVSWRLMVPLRLLSACSMLAWRRAPLIAGCPAACGPEAAWAGGIRVLAPPSLIALINHFKGTQVLSPPQALPPEAAEQLPDMRDIKGQESAKRALEVAAAGGHNMAMVGPPGSGKSMLASRLPGILPPMDACEALEVSMIASLAGELRGGTI